MTVTGKMERYAEQLESSQERYGLVVDGASLHLIMPVEENKKLLFQVFTYQSVPFKWRKLIPERVPYIN